MSKSRPRFCKDCHVRLPGRRELEQADKPMFWLRSKVCDECSHRRGVEQRERVGARLLARATPAGTLERDGQTFTVVQLPPKRRHK